MFNLDVNILRIENGFIVTGNDCKHVRRYYPTLQAFVELEMLESARQEDTYFLESDADGIEFDIRAHTTAYVRSADSALKSSVIDQLSEAARGMGDKQLTPVSDPVEVGKALREMRLSLCQTQGFMAEFFGVPLSMWSTLENPDNG